MPDQAIQFTPYTAPDLTGLRAGHVVNYAGTLYDVERVEVIETLDGRDKDTGAPLMIETRVELRLQRARWTDAPWIEPPTDVLVLPELQGERKTVINGQSYWLYSALMNRAYPARGPRTPEHDVPDSIELQLIRNPMEDPEPDHA